jgi:hypothetical protein
MLIGRLKGLLLYIAERKILVIALTYILGQSFFLAFSWLGLSAISFLSFFLFLKFRKIFCIVIIVIILCALRNYVDLYLENESRDFVEENYLNKNVGLEGYVYKEPIYKHDYARVVFKISGEKDFLLQANISRFPRLKVGQICKISGNVVEPHSDGDFDYKKYLQTKRIYYIAKYPFVQCYEEREGFFLKNFLADIKGKVRLEVEKKIV